MRRRGDEECEGDEGDGEDREETRGRERLRDEEDAGDRMAKGERPLRVVGGAGAGQEATAGSASRGCESDGRR